MNNYNKAHAEPISIATITHAGSFVDLFNFLTELKPAIENYSGECELLVINNSGQEYVEQTRELVEQARIEAVATVKVIGSVKNNIATARNIALEHAEHDLLIYIDDDGFPVPQWLELLTATLRQEDAQMVAGPTLPLYLFETPDWVKTVDLHNARNRSTGQVIDKTTAGNLMLRRSSVIGEPFNEVYGESGGEDTEFLMRQFNAGLKLVWCKEAAVYEYIPKDKSSAKYFIKRFVVQGQLYRKVMTELGDIKSPSRFVLKSLVMIAMSLLIAPVLVLISNKHAGIWVKRGFANFGHLSNFSKKLYPTTKSDE